LSPSLSYSAETSTTPTREVIVQTDLIARANPSGILLQVGALHRSRLGAPPRVDWPAPYLDIGVATGLNPAYAQGTLDVEWMPIAPFILRLQGDLFGYFGANGALLEMPNGQAAFGAKEINALSGHERTKLGERIMIQPTLRLKFGPFIVRNQTDLAWYRFGGSGPYFYEWEYDVLLKNGDGLFANRTAILVQLWARGNDALLLLGPYYELRRSFAAELQRQRFGGIAFFCPTDRVYQFSRPRFYIQTGLNVEDRNRQNELFIVGGLGFDFDAYRSKGNSP
jgi:hypothetical protein